MEGPANSSSGFALRYKLWEAVAIGTALSVIILATVLGNIFVIAAIVIERNLQSVSNYLLISLAIADLMVATLVMPVSALNQISKVWWLGSHMCDLWVCLDVLCCTASILHLVGIALDRYWAVTNVKYVRSQSASRIGFVIGLTWLISVAISVPARFYPSKKGQANGFEHCQINDEPGYTVFSTIGAFYLPMLFMLVIYLAIYRAVKRRIRRKCFNRFASSSAAGGSLLASGAGGSSAVADGAGISERSSSRSTRRINFARSMPRLKSSRGKASNVSNTTEASVTSVQTSPAPNSPRNTCGSCIQRDRLVQARERRAARTLAVVTGCFMICWLPFFVHASLCPFNRSFCASVLSDTGHAVIQWLGYTNSMLNPVIYTVFSPDFRCAFNRIIFRRRSGHRNH